MEENSNDRASLTKKKSIHRGKHCGRLWTVQRSSNNMFGQGQIHMSRKRK
jgi:hypothetical protein